MMSAKKYYFAASYFGLFEDVAATAQNNISLLHLWIYCGISVISKILTLILTKEFNYFRIDIFAICLHKGRKN